MSRNIGFTKKFEFQIMSSCLWCEKPIPLRPKGRGNLICSFKCLNQMKKKGLNYDHTDVIDWSKEDKCQEI